jgi:hypothetical protein
MPDRSAPSPEAASHSLRRVVRGFVATGVLASALSLWLSIATGDWTWFSRSGAILTALGLVMASRKILIARADLVALLSDMERTDGAERTARLESFKRLQRDLDRQVMEKAGFALLLIGTLIWGYGDLLGKL